MAEDPKLALLGKNLFLEILNGNQLFLGTLLENLFLRALFLLATLLGNGSWDLAWEPFLETVLASGFEELNLAWEPLPGYLLGSLFLGTCLETSSWEPLLANLFLATLLENLFLATLLGKLFLGTLLGNLFLETLPGNFFREPYL